MATDVPEAVIVCPNDQGQSTDVSTAESREEGAPETTDVSTLQGVIQTVNTIQPQIAQLQQDFKELSILVQTVQATTYDGVFVWKIPEIKRRRADAISEKTVSLYSAPFYTSRHGYKMCLRLYLNGDGSGKGTHLSFFLTLMKGEYDALLPWPFRQAVTLILLDQSRKDDIIQSFKADGTSSSFQRPEKEMSVASGCPTFAPLSVLDNPAYVKDDVMFLQCVVDLVGLHKI